MLRGVLAIVMFKVVLRWICRASWRNGMIWPCAMKGIITMCPFFFAVSAAIGAKSFLLLVSDTKCFYELQLKLKR